MKRLAVFVAAGLTAAGCGGSGHLSGARIDAQCSRTFPAGQVGPAVGGMTSQSEVTVARLRSALTHAHRAIPSFLRSASGGDYLAVCGEIPPGASTTVCPSGDLVNVGEVVRVIDNKGRVVTLPNEAMLYPEMPDYTPCSMFKGRPGG